LGSARVLNRNASVAQQQLLLVTLLLLLLLWFCLQGLAEKTVCS
jgi:hypothetical protein